MSQKWAYVRSGRVLSILTNGGPETFTDIAEFLVKAPDDVECGWLVDEQGGMAPPPAPEPEKQDPRDQIIGLLTAKLIEAKIVSQTDVDAIIAPDAAVP